MLTQNNTIRVNPLLRYNLNLEPGANAGDATMTALQWKHTIRPVEPEDASSNR